MRLPTRQLTLLATALLCAGLARAQSLLEMVEAARQHDATYLAALSQRDATVAKGDQSNLLPTVSVGASQNRNRSASDPGTEGTYTSRSVTLNASQPIYKPALWASYKQGQDLYGIARAQLDLAEQDLLVRTSQAYFDVLVAQETLVLVKAQKAANAEQLAAAKRNFEVGTATITDTHEAQARYDLTVAQEIAAESDVQIRRLALSTIVGKPAPQPKGLQGKANVPDIKVQEMQRWVDQAQASHPSIELARLGLNTARLEVDKAEAGHKPTLDGVLSYGTTRHPDGTSTSSNPSRSTSGYVGLSLNVPIFAGGATQARVRETLALEEKSRADLEAAQRLVAQNTRITFLNVMTGKSQVVALEAAEASSKSALEANQLGYQVGVRVNIDVLNAQSQLYQTRRDLAKARYDLLMADLKMRQAAGALKLDDLRVIERQLVK
jgi:outer membrane protein